MPNIKEIALKVGAQGLPIEGPAHKYCMLDFCSKEVLIEFAEALIAEALIAELAKGNEPVMVLFQHKDTGRTTSIEPQSASDFGRINKRWINCGPLFSFPPTAEQIANETAWQPIETAPVLSNVLVTRFDYGQVCWVTDARKSKFGFWSTFNGRAVNEPTHWMPLPTPPKRSMEGV